MNYQLRNLLACSISLALVACGSSDSNTNTATDGGNNDTGNSTTGDPTTPPADDSTNDNTSNGDTGSDDSGNDSTNDDTSGGSGGGDNSGDSTGGGNGGTGTTSGNARFYGGISITDRAFDNRVTLDGGFGRFGFDVPVSSLEQQLAQRDTCEVTESGPPNSGFELPDFDNVGTTFQLVSAGDPIPFTSANGTFAELRRQDQFGFTVYTTDSDVEGPVPTGLSVTVPGDVFPAFPNLLVPEVSRVQWFGPGAGEVITPGSTLSWQPGANPDAVVTMSTFSLPSAGNLSIVSVTCVMTDDGSFTFPAETQAAMGAAFSASGPPSISRRVETVAQGNNAVLVITRESEGIQ